MAEQSMRRVAIVGGVRTPFCRAFTSYSDLTNLDMMTTALNGLVARYELEGEYIDEVFGGAVVVIAPDTASIANNPASLPAANENVSVPAGSAGSSGSLAASVPTAVPAAAFSTTANV